MNSRLDAMTDEQLGAELARLKEGQVGPGFDKTYLPQAVKLVEDKIKQRKKLQPKEEKK